MSKMRVFSSLGIGFSFAASVYSGIKEKMELKKLVKKTCCSFCYFLMHINYTAFIYK